MTRGSGLTIRSYPMMRSRFWRLFDRIRARSRVYLLTLPGIGKVLALTIMLETGPLRRFAKVGNYVSYCRKVSSQWISNEKAKGKGNKKNGNKYLAWAFSEAAESARRYHA